MPAVLSNMIKRIDYEAVAKRLPGIIVKAVLCKGMMRTEEIVDYCAEQALLERCREEKMEERKEKKEVKKMKETKTQKKRYAMKEYLWQLRLTNGHKMEMN